MHPVCSLSLAAALAATLPAQCGFDWLTGAPAGGPNDAVDVLLRLPNGDLFAGGRFEIAGGVALRAAVRDANGGAGWGAIGGGFDGTVRAAAVMPNGDLVVAGFFNEAGGQPANQIARWNGTAWSPMGGGIDGELLDLLATPGGELFACRAPAIGGMTFQWNGTAWVGLGLSGTGFSRSLALGPNGDVYCCGRFGSTGLARRDPNTWVLLSAIDTPAPLFAVEDIATMANGSIFGVGLVQAPNATPHRAFVYDGTSVQYLTPPVTANPFEAFVRGNGDAVLLAPGNQETEVAVWDGTAWATLPPAPAGTHKLTEDANGDLVAAVGGGIVSGTDIVLRFDGTDWVALDPTPVVAATASKRDGSVVVGGSFEQLGGVAAHNLARWDGASFAPIGTGVDGPVLGLAIAPDDSLVVAGRFETAGGVVSPNVVRWDGQGFVALGAGLPQEASITDVTVASDGSIFATGRVDVWRFDGATWSQLALPGAAVLINCVQALPSGSVAIGGIFTSLGLNGLLEYDQGTVSLFPGTQAIGLIETRHLALAANGDLLAATGASSVGVSVLRWNGASWSNLGNPLFGPLVELPNGDVLAVSDPEPLTGAIARIEGGMAGGARTAETDVLGEVAAMAFAGDGSLFFGGRIASVDDVVSGGLARAQPLCPAATSVIGAGCTSTGGAGPVVLTADSLPWLGATYRSTATGLPPGSLSVQAVGLPTAAVPLPFAPAGCQLLTSPILTNVQVPIAGAASMTFFWPNLPALLGVAIREQVIGLELGPVGIVEFVSSNGLDLTTGAL